MKIAISASCNTVTYMIYVFNIIELYGSKTWGTDKKDVNTIYAQQL